MTSSIRNFVEPGRTRLAARLIKVNSRPNTNKLRRGQINSRRSRQTFDTLSLGWGRSSASCFIPPAITGKFYSALRDHHAGYISLDQQGTAAVLFEVRRQLTKLLL